MGFNIRILWNCLSVFLVFSSVYLFASIFRFRGEADKIGLEYNPWSDLYEAGFYFVMIAAVRFLATLIAKPILYQRLQDVDPATFDVRKQKIVRQFLNFLWYIFIVVYGNIALAGHPYVPTWLNGSGTCRGLLHEYGTKKGDSIINKYYMIESAQHFYTLIEHLFFLPRQKDFSEMALHHLCAMAAILFSYFTNQVAFGAAILLIHDYADIFIYLTKLMRDLQIGKSWMIDVSYLMVFLSFIFPRIILVSSCVLPAGIYYRHFDHTFVDPAKQELMDSMFLVDTLQIVQVMIIMLLNFFWTGIIVQTGYNKYVSGKTKNFVIQSQEDIPANLLREKELAKAGHQIQSAKTSGN